MLLKKLIGFLKLLFVITCNLIFPPAHIIWILMFQPIKLISPSLYDSIESILFSWAVKTVPMWIWLGNVTVEEAGDSLVDCYNDKSLVMCNHQSTSDVPLVMYYLSTKPDLLKRVSWVMDIMFKYTHFGIMSQIHHDYFIKQGRDTRSDELIKFKEFLLGSYSVLNRKWMILFPEGGFFYKRKERSQSYASKHGYVHLNHTTLPRCGALDIALNALASESRMSDKGAIQQQQSRCEPIKWIIDLTICYPKGNAISISELFSGRTLFDKPLKILFLTRRFPASDVAGKSEDKLKTWFYNRWAEKDEMLKRYYETGQAYVPDSSYIRAASSDTSINYGTPKQSSKVLHGGAGGSPKPMSHISFVTSKSDNRRLSIPSVVTENQFELLEMKERRPKRVKLNFLNLLAIYFYFIISCVLHYRNSFYAISFLVGYAGAFLKYLSS